jgi:hypothetical protein
MGRGVSFKEMLFRSSCSCKRLKIFLMTLEYVWKFTRGKQILYSKTVQMFEGISSCTDPKPKYMIMLKQKFPHMTVAVAKVEF